MKEDTVYFFSTYDVDSDQIVRSKRPATRFAIGKLGDRFRVIEESAFRVDCHELDPDGFLIQTKMNRR
jgi:hypothetical protein